jgi:hypothetical protein
MRFAIFLSVAAGLHLVGALRYELRKPLRNPDPWVDFGPTALGQVCSTAVPNDWLHIQLYVRCYGRDFEGRLHRMKGPADEDTRR